MASLLPPMGDLGEAYLAVYAASLVFAVVFAAWGKLCRDAGKVRFALQLLWLSPAGLWMALGLLWDLAQTP